MNERKSIFVTVGTTSFDGLLEQLDTKEWLTLVRDGGYKKLVVQIGRGNNELKSLVQYNKDAGSPLELDIYRFKPSLQQDLEEASLVISHAGAGSIL